MIFISVTVWHNSEAMGFCGTDMHIKSLREPELSEHVPPDKLSISWISVPIVKTTNFLLDSYYCYRGTNEYVEKFW